MVKPQRFGKQLLGIVALAAVFASCEKNDDVQPLVGVEATNDWIYKTMKDVYLWTDEMPAADNLKQDPTAYFESLLSNKDRFSFITPNYQELINSLNGVNKEAGYEFLLSRVSNTSEEVVAIVLYTKENSPAESAGLQRGDVITNINGATITMSNYQSLLGEIDDTHTVGYKRFNAAVGEYEEQSSLTLTTVALAENPHYIDTVYQTPNGQRVGYYMYNFFSPGTTKAEEYDQQMDAIIAEFKSKGVNELILDLRYNSGGAVSSATNLASLIGKGVDESHVFYENHWNQSYQDYFNSLEDGEDIIRGKFLSKPNGIGNQLSSGKVYVLVGSRTASASELIINGLKPYMDVVIIGEQTVGKNVGSIPIEDKKNPENTYGLLPIVFQIYNSSGQSDYAEGFVPSSTNTVDDFQLPMQPLGDINEPLLQHALSLIDGSMARMSSTQSASKMQVVPIMSSIDQKVRSNRLILDQAVF